MREAAGVWESGDVWRLLKEGEVVGEIVVEQGDFPWLSGRFVSRPGFDTVRPLFQRELALMEEEEWEEWDTVLEEIRQNLQMVAPAGPVPEFLLHIEGDRAWFRWSDEPFE